MRLKYVTYNPMHCNNNRLSLIIAEFSKFVLLLLPGTMRKDINSSSNGCDIFQTNNFTVCSFGYGKSTYSNKSCGCIIAFNNKYFDRVRTVYNPPPELKGRAGAIRLVRPDIDILVIVIYFPPDPNNPSDKHCVQMIVDWVRKIINKTGNRCITVLGGDPNAKVGFDYLGNSYSPYIGQIKPDKENFNGIKFRQMLCDNELSAINTFYDVGNTYYGKHKSTRIDYSCISTHVFNDNKVEACFLLHKSGDRLQPITVCGRRDHRPMATIVNHQLTYCKNNYQGNRFSNDLMMLAVTKSFRVFEFVKEVDDWAQQIMEKDDWIQQRDETNGTSMWLDCMKEIGKMAEKYYSCEVSPKNDTKEHKKNIVDMQQECLDRICKLVRLQPESRIQFHFENWKCIVKTRKIEKQVFKLNRAHHVKKKKELTDELYIAWESRDLAHMWKLAKMLAGKGARKKRNLISLTSEQWVAGFVREGSSGGCSAELIDWNSWAGVVDSESFCSKHFEAEQHEENVRMQSIPIEHHLFKHKYENINFVSGGLLVDHGTKHNDQQDKDNISVSSEGTWGSDNSSIHMFHNTNNKYDDSKCDIKSECSSSSGGAWSDVNDSAPMQILPLCPGLLLPVPGKMRKKSVAKTGRISAASTLDLHIIILVLTVNLQIIYICMISCSVLKVLGSSLFFHSVCNQEDMLCFPLLLIQWGED